MYYRRKIILSLLDDFGGKLSKLKFQKLLFLLTREQENRSFDFVPYKYGPFSFQSYQDKRTMTKYGQLSGIESWEKIDNTNYINEIYENDKNILHSLKDKYFDVTESKLIEFVYTKYPEYAANSEIKNRINYDFPGRPINDNYEFFTIGYEGHTIDSYIYLLYNNNIKLLCDVRKNALSMKYGFSKNQLKNILNKFNIEYVHIPELGIESDKRQQLNTQEDYEKLFDEYQKNILPNKTLYLEQLLTLFKGKKRIAITCFESNPNMCHRNKIAEYLQNKKDRDYRIVHI